MQPAALSQWCWQLSYAFRDVLDDDTLIFKTLFVIRYWKIRVQSTKHGLALYAIVHKASIKETIFSHLIVYLLLCVHEYNVCAA